MNEVIAEEEALKVEPPAAPVAPVELEAPMEEYQEEYDDEEEEEEEEYDEEYDPPFSLYSHRDIRNARISDHELAQRQN